MYYCRFKWKILFFRASCIFEKKNSHVFTSLCLRIPAWAHVHEWKYLNIEKKQHTKVVRMCSKASSLSWKSSSLSYCWQKFCCFILTLNMFYFYFIHASSSRFTLDEHRNNECNDPKNFLIIVQFEQHGEQSRIYLNVSIKFKKIWYMAHLKPFLNNTQWKLMVLLPIIWFWLKIYCKLLLQDFIT